MTGMVRHGRRAVALLDAREALAVYGQLQRVAALVPLKEVAEYRTALEKLRAAAQEASA
jgi:hypothetical protein